VNLQESKFERVEQFASSEDIWLHLDETPAASPAVMLQGRDASVGQSGDRPERALLSEGDVHTQQH
jgi:hypothetical protein